MAASLIYIHFLTDFWSHLALQYSIWCPYFSNSLVKSIHHLQVQDLLFHIHGLEKICMDSKNNIILKIFITQMTVDSTWHAACWF